MDDLGFMFCTSISFVGCQATHVGLRWFRPSQYFDALIASEPERDLNSWPMSSTLTRMVTGRSLRLTVKSATANNAKRRDRVKVNEAVIIGDWQPP